MTHSIEFDRWAVERVMRSYSNDLLSAFHSAVPVSDSDKRNAIARAQSMLSDIDYLNGVADSIREQVRSCQAAFAKNDQQRI